MTSNLTPELIAIGRQKAREDFAYFVRLFWDVVSSDPFRDGYLVETFCLHLQALAEGRITRLYIACPIRKGKTILTQVLFPAWLWARDPSLRLLSATHNETMAEEVCVKARQLVTSEKFQQFFPLSLSEDQNKKLSFNNEAGGTRKGCGVGTRISGASADVVLVDDLIDFQKAKSETQRKEAIDFYTDVLSKRLVPTSKARILVTGHRVHEADLFAHLFETFGDDTAWTWLVLPEEARPDYTNSFHNGIGWKDTRQEGELLAPERFDANWIRAEKKSLRHKYNILYQQDTTPQKGDRFDSNWFRYYTEDAEHYLCDGVKLKKSDAWRVATSDAAISTTSDSDWTVCQIWDVIGDYCILVAQFRKKVDGTQIIPALVDFTNQYEPQFLLVEEEFVGKFIIDQLREKGVTVRRFNSKNHGTKETRSIAFEIRCESKKVWFPANQDWVGTLTAELLSFPRGAHDDQVDCCSQMAITATRYRGEITEEETPEQRAQAEQRRRIERFNAILNSGCPFN